ncbi:MAG: alpha/beta hydrolase [Alphaproteobacteria bacterium]|nr:alpha/beta hydrolase [Alphaproteobacteria bacterium]
MTSQAQPQSTIHLVAPELAAAIELFPNMDFENGLDEIREGFMNRDLPPMPEGLGRAVVEDRTIPGPTGAPDVRVLIYSPPGPAAGKRPAVLHIHGGGFVIGRADIGDIPNRMLALTLGCVVVSVDYRKAPETVWPGPIKDCYAALTWMVANADALVIDPKRIAVAGESAGGGHAAALAIHARNLARKNPGAPTFCFQLLDSPMLDDRTGTTSDPHPHVGEFVWTPARNRFGWKSLLGMEPGGPDVPEEMVPARVSDYSDLPPAFVHVGALDLFLEEDMEYVRRLTRSGNPAELYVIPGAYHGFNMAGATPQVMQVGGLRMAALARAFGVSLGGG